ncbi:MAG TPA: arginine deiminase-related protein [Balneolaceae bacterium]|nr:arginine deiminase-related protein [Balneolaceae bacterium]
MTQVISSANQLNFNIDELPEMPLPSGILMVEPSHFTVDYVINPYMADNIGKVNQEAAAEEWSRIKNMFKKTGLNVEVIEGEEDAPDMVFCANQSLPAIDEDGNKQVIMSIMHSGHRKDEVPFIENWFRENGYRIHHLDEDKIESFEGCGDAIWHTGRRLLWGGYGFRTSTQAYETISEIFDVPVIALQLVDEDFYHLDTCFCVLNEKTVLIYPPAFTDEGLKLIETLFENIITANTREAKELFACNATCADGKNVLIQEGCLETIKQLKRAGFKVHPLETGEFLKSGGSVFCMKQMVW